MFQYKHTKIKAQRIKVDRQSGQRKSRNTTHNPYQRAFCNTQLLSIDFTYYHPIKTMKVVSRLASLRPHVTGPYNAAHQKVMKEVSKSPQAHNFRRKGTRRVNRIVKEMGKRGYVITSKDIWEIQRMQVAITLGRRGYHVTWMPSDRENATVGKVDALNKVFAKLGTSIAELLGSKCLRVRQDLKAYGHIIRRADREGELPNP